MWARCRPSSRLTCPLKWLQCVPRLLCVAGPVLVFNGQNSSQGTQEPRQASGWQRQASGRAREDLWRMRQIAGLG